MEHENRARGSMQLFLEGRKCWLTKRSISGKTYVPDGQALHFEIEFSGFSMSLPLSKRLASLFDGAAEGNSVDQQ